MIPKRAHFTADFKTLMLKTCLKIDKKVIKLQDMSLRMALSYDPTVTKPYWGTSETSSADMTEIN